MRTFIPAASLLLALSPTVTSGLKIASVLQYIEYTPEKIAAQDFYKGEVTFSSGGIANIVSGSSIDLGANAETQALRNFPSHKNLRIIATVSEVAYRIVANKNKIASIKDLKGKRIGTMSGTSAGYFIYKYLNSVGLKEGDYTLASGSICSAAPCGSGTLPAMLKAGTIDAFGIWEPSVQLAVDQLGADAITFSDKSVYREIYNLHTTAEKLKDASSRKEIVAFVKALIQAQKVFEETPDKVIPRVAQAVGMDQKVVKGAWVVHSFKGGLPSDLLDFLVEEDEWVAKNERRKALSKADLTPLIDSSVLKEAAELLTKEGFNVTVTF